MRKRAAKPPTRKKAFILARFAMRAADDYIPAVLLNKG